MQDFSRAEGSKNHRASFYKASNNIIDYIQYLQNKYRGLSERLEEARKERAAIIEETIQLLKNNKVKLGKQLGRCNNAEINRELLNAINTLNYIEKEKVQINLIKINNRYELICSLGRQLEALSENLTRYRVLENDYDEEVEIILPRKNKSNTNSEKDAEPIDVPSKKEDQTTSTLEPEKDLAEDKLEKVVAIKPANANLAQQLEQIHESYQDEVSTDHNDESAELTETETSEIYQESEDIYIDPEKLFDTQEMVAIQSEVDYAIDANDNSSDYYQEDENQVDDENDYVLFTINAKITLAEIAKNVYQDENCWEDIYYYGDNQEKIDLKALENELTVEEIVSSPGYLADVTLQFPTSLEVRKEKSEETISRSRVA